jgi:hypothetical protein
MDKAVDQMADKFYKTKKASGGLANLLGE